MKEDKTENPSAFPDPMRGAEQSFVNQSPDEHGQGMTLRDYFAAKAMQGTQIGLDQKSIDEQARLAYKIADAMLKQRNQ